MDKYIYIGLTLGLTLYTQLIVKSRALVYASAATGGRKLEYLSAMFTDVGVLSGLFAGVLASVCWALALEKTPLTVAYPFVALNFVLTPAAAYVLLGDPINLLQLLGLALIVAGVTLTAFAA